MKKKSEVIRLSVALLIVTLIGTMFYVQLMDSPSKRLSIKDQVAVYNNKSYDEIKRMQKYDRPDMAVMQNFEMTKDPAINDVPVERTMRAFKTLKNDKGLASRAIQGVNWAERGPDNVGGRTRTLMFDPNDGTNRKVWAGSVGGGLWFNNDITSSSGQWQNVNDFWANLALTTITFDPTNTQTFYVGTGEGYFNFDAIRGAGIWKSTNGGSSWSQLASTDNSDFFYVQKVVVTGSGAVLAATHTGLFRSTNGGSSWTQILSGGRFADIEIAANGDIYASRGVFQPGVLFKSTNDGVSFSDVTPATGGQRIEIATAPSDANTVYAVASDGNTNNIAWFRKTTNGGSSWTNVTIPTYLEQNCSFGSQQFTRGQAWYDLIMAVSPTNPNIVLVGGIDIHRSTNGGSSWSSVSYWTGNCRSFVHADQHAMVFRPGSPDAAIFGHDGGVSYSANVGNSGATPSFSTRVNGYNVTQFYAADQINAIGSNVMLAGAQDNGSHRFTQAGINSTVEVSGGDGAFCHIDQDNGNFQISSFVFNVFFRSTNGGASFSNILNNQNFGRFINPTELDDNANILYSAANEDQYIRISGISGSTNPQLINANLGGFRASAITASPYTNNRIFIGTGTNAGTGGSKVFRVDNANGTPTVTEISTASIPGNGYISSVAIGSSDNQIMVTLSNYGLVSVWETRNGGTSWVNREGNLPDMPIRWALYNPNNTNEVLLATELGVWSVENVNVSSPLWEVTNTGLANVRTDMLQYRDSDGQVIVATHGRGVYTAQPFSGGGGDTQAPTTPGGLSVTNVTSNSFTMSWNASTDNVGVTNYTVSLDGSVVGSPTSTSFNFTGLSPATTYTVSVVANDAAGNSSATATRNVTTSSAGISCSSTVSSFPYLQGLESGSGDWVQPSGDDGDWVSFSGSTPSGTTGPTSAFQGTRYLYLEASTNGTAGQIGNNATAILESPCYDLSPETSATFNFRYHMFGSNMGTLQLEASTDGINYTQIWSRTGDQGNAWLEANVSLSTYLGGIVKLRFRGTTGPGWQSDMAIDDFSLTTGSGGGSSIPCSSTVSSFPYNESFESGAGTFVQATGDDGNWVNTSGGTPSGSTGPSGAINGSFYMFTEASSNNTPGAVGSNATLFLESPCLDLSAETAANFNFNYHMLGSNMGSLNVDVTTDGTNWTTIWTRSGNQGSAWLNGTVSLNAYLGTTIKVRFRGVTGPSWQSDMAIDNVNVSATAITGALAASPVTINEKIEGDGFVKAYPNPVVDVLHIDAIGFGKSSYTIVSLTGAIVASGEFQDKEILNVEDLKSGYYLIKLNTDEGTHVEKILIR